MELKQKQILITIWILGNPECLRSVADRFNITKSILFRVYRRIWSDCQQSFRSIYEVPGNWTPLGKMIYFGSFAQRNAFDQWSNDPSLDHADQLSDESLSRVDLIDHWSENGFARKGRHRSEILIRILPKERTLNLILITSRVQFGFDSSYSREYIKIILHKTYYTKRKKSFFPPVCFFGRDRLCLSITTIHYWNSFRDRFRWIHIARIHLFASQASFSKHWTTGRNLNLSSAAHIPATVQ